jgi:tight adherence protein C
MSYAILAFVAVAAVTAIVGLVLTAFVGDPVSRRLRTVKLGKTGANAESILRGGDERAAALGAWGGWVEKLGALLLGRVPEIHEARRTAVRQRLAMAGYDDPRSPLFFLGAKLVVPAVLVAAYLLYALLVKRLPPGGFLMVVVILGVGGFYLPDLFLSRRIRKRKRLITNALPDLLDLLVVCVEAGLALDAAIARITDQAMSKPTPLHEELRRVHLEFRAGRPRAEALQALVWRTGVDEVRTVVGAFIQTEKLGTSLADTMRVHAEAARVQRRHRAEKQAHLAPLKMLFPMVFFLFPAIFLVTLAPATLGLYEAFKFFGR